MFIMDEELMSAFKKANESIQDWSIAKLLEEAQSDDDLWQALCLEVDAKNPEAAATFLKSLIEIGDIIEFVGDSLFVAIVALHNVCGCMNAVAKGVAVPFRSIAEKIPCTQFQFRITNDQSSYKLVFAGDQCEYVKHVNKSSIADETDLV